MNKRKLGKTDLELSAIGFGAWAIGGGQWEYAWGPQDDTDSLNAILRAYELGINWVDTAASYGLGHSEIVVGKALKELGRDNLIIATKCGIKWDNTGKINLWVDAAQVRREIDDSLRRLNIETIDLYQVHWPSPDENIEEVWSEMANCVRQGKARHIGVSNFNVDQVRRAMKIAPVASVQNRYSIIHREIENDLLPFCDENKIGVVCYSPMAKGLLTGKMTPDSIASFAPDDHRRNDPDFIGQKLQTNLQLVSALEPIARRSGKTLAQLALAWTLRRNEVTSAIAGARNGRQIEDTAKAGDWKLAVEDVEEIAWLLEKYENATVATF